MFDGFYTKPPTYDSVSSAIAYLRDTYKNLKIFPIGKSVLGREINALCIGNPMGATLFVGATHGLEWLTAMLLIRFCETVLEGLRSGGWILVDFGCVVVHLFLKDIREFYSLERLWVDAKTVDIEEIIQEKG